MPGRWHDVLNPSIDGANAHATGKWGEDEDLELRNAVQTHGGKNWAAIAALVPGRAESQCRNRWHHVLDPSIDRANGRTGRWTKDEDIKLKDAVQTHGGKIWKKIATLVPGRTVEQCRNKWTSMLQERRLPENERTGTWTEGEDSTLKDAVQTHGGKNWGAIAALVPDRTKSQCQSRW